MSDDALRIAVIGCGQIAQQHMQKYAELEGVRMVTTAARPIGWPR